MEQTGLVYVRGCEIQGMLDEKGRVIEEGVHIPTLVGRDLLQYFLLPSSLFSLFVDLLLL